MTRRRRCKKCNGLFQKAEIRWGICAPCYGKIEAKAQAELREHHIKTVPVFAFGKQLHGEEAEAMARRLMDLRMVT